MDFLSINFKNYNTSRTQPLAYSHTLGPGNTSPPFSSSSIGYLFTIAFNLSSSSSPTNPSITWPHPTSLNFWYSTNPPATSAHLAQTALPRSSAQTAGPWGIELLLLLPPPSGTHSLHPLETLIHCQTSNQYSKPTCSN